MRSRAFRPIAVLLSALLLTSTPVQAGPVGIGDVMQIIGNYQNPPELRLRSFSQTSSTPVAGIKGSSQAASNYDDNTAGIIDTSIAPATPGDSLLAGVADGGNPQETVDIIAQGDVEGSICDCGEVTVPGGGFPKWPLLFLAAIPFFFIHGCDDCETPTPTPTPTPEIPIPEPASLLLFGSGLAAFGAGLRRRYAKAKLMAQMDTTEEG